MIFNKTGQINYTRKRERETEMGSEKSGLQSCREMQMRYDFLTLRMKICRYKVLKESLRGIVFSLVMSSFCGFNYPKDEGFKTRTARSDPFKGQSRT